MLFNEAPDMTSLSGQSDTQTFQEWSYDSVKERDL